MEQRLYPIGIQDFSELRNGNYLYVDKTDIIYKLVSTGKYYFLSRPRRFGKSLLINTLEAYFLGKKELFKGLAIEKLEKDWKSYPVLHFDFSDEKVDSRAELKADLEMMITELEQQYKCTPPAQASVNKRFSHLVKFVYETTGNQVVILIDEYDAAMLENVDNPKVQDGVKKEMRKLFSPIKKMDKMLKFVFFTGVTKFSQMSIFSELNNLEIISMIPDYDSLCGISKDELLTTLKPDVQTVADKVGCSYDEMLLRLKDMYDGYHFSRAMTDMFNPYSLLRALKEGNLGDYWFGSGTPTMLIKLLNKFDLVMADLEGAECTLKQFDTPVEHTEDPIPVLYQSGYLTIKSIDANQKIFTLGFPNLEVRQGFAESLLNYNIPKQDGRTRTALYKAYLNFALDDDLEKFIAALKVFYAGFPYELNNKNEHHYHALLYTLLVSFGADVVVQPQTANGRADVVLRMSKSLYVIELKYNQSADAAIKQIKDKGYAEPYMMEDRRVVLVGINFDKKGRNVKGWKYEVVKS